MSDGPPPVADADCLAAPAAFLVRCFLSAHTLKFQLFGELFATRLPGRMFMNC